jgi:hypothetical protein
MVRGGMDNPAGLDQLVEYLCYRISPAESDTLTDEAYRKTKNFEKAARLLQLDRRTVRAKVVKTPG